MEAYLDNSATTKCAREVVETVVKAMQDDYGNPSSKHMKGVDAEQYIKQAAATIARSLKCQEKELVFTSGGTESNNMAIIGTAMANKRRGNHVIVSSVVHHKRHRASGRVCTVGVSGGAGLSRNLPSG